MPPVVSANLCLSEIKPLLSRLYELDPTGTGTDNWLARLDVPYPALVALGTDLVAEQAPAAACAVLQECTRRQPGDPQVRHNQGVALQQLGRFNEAAVCFSAAAALQPIADAAPSLAAQGVALRQAGRREEAIEVLRNAICAGHDTPELRWNLSLALLSARRYEEAWPYYESRHVRPDKPSWAIMDESDWPMWRGEPLAGKRLLVVGEQGLGDQIQFRALLPKVRAEGASIDFLVSPGLKPLFEGSAGIEAVHETRPRHKVFDYWAYLLSIPLHLRLNSPERLVDSGTDVLTIPPDKQRYFAELIAGHAPGKLKIGIVWAGNPGHANDRFRSMPLDTLASILALDANWVSLQREIPARDLTSPWRPHLLEIAHDFRSMADTAAAMAGLDLVITIDSAPAHLAARLGIPTWVFLPANVDWRWPHVGETTFWYPSMRLFHQITPGDWTAPVAKVRKQLAKLIAAQGSTHAIP